MSDKLLSIIVPSYNMEAYLRHCLNSVLLEDKLDLFEVIVINDGSNDKTSEIAHEFAARYPQAYRVIDKSNGHYGSCINAGLRIASGEFVKILEADDWYDTKVFAEFIALLENVRGKVDVVYSNMACVSADDKPLKYDTFDYPEGRVFDFAEITNCTPCRANTAICYRTHLLREIGYHQPEGLPYTDNLWTTVPFSKVRKCAFLPKVLYRYWVGRPGQSMSPDIWKRNVSSMVRVLGFMLDEYEKLPKDIAEVNRDFFIGAIESIAVIVYQALFHHTPVSYTLAVFKSLDDRLKTVVPNVYKRLNDLEILSSIKGVAYVTVSRHSKFMLLMMLALVRCVCFVGAFRKKRQ